MSVDKPKLLILAGVLCLGLVVIPWSGTAQAGVHIGFGFGWWGLPWCGPYGWPYYYGPSIHVPIRVPPRCHDIWVPGRWETDGKEDARGFTTYHQYWVPGHWERVCR